MFDKLFLQIEWVLYIYGPCCREIWSFVYPQKSYFSRASPSRNMTSSGKQTFIRPREIWLLQVNKPSYLPTTRAIHCLLYRNYTHNNKTCFSPNLTFYSICEGLFTRKSHISRRRSSRRYVTLPMGTRGSGIHDIYFPGSRGLGIHEVLSSWHVTYFN
jgi:hypothetical protein